MPHSAWFVAALGLLLAALFVSTAAATSGESCDPCSEIGGQWFHAIALSLAGSNLFGWLLGTIAGAALARRARSS